MTRWPAAGVTCTPFAWPVPTAAPVAASRQLADVSTQPAGAASVIVTAAPAATEAKVAVSRPVPEVVAIEKDFVPAKAKVPSPPVATFSTSMLAAAVLVNVQVTVSPAARLIAAVVPEPALLPVGSVQLIAVSFQPAGTCSVTV